MTAHNDEAEPATFFESMYRSRPDPFGFAAMTPHNKRRARVLRMLSPIFRDKRIVEVGCAEGEQTKFFASIGRAVLAFDISEAAIARAQRLELRGTMFRVSGMTEFSEWGAFDVITMIECLYYLPADDQARVLDAIARSGHGTLVISAPVIGRGQHRKYYTDSELKSLLARHGFSIEQEHVVGLQRPASFLPGLIIQIFKAFYLLPLGGLLDPVWNAVPARWVYKKLFVARF
jgi:2-polyprenyl-3-methyl-5-hydroxy-6-metoxy-1,4-benzoquinol methylase